MVCGRNGWCVGGMGGVWEGWMVGGRDGWCVGGISNVEDECVVR